MLVLAVLVTVMVVVFSLVITWGVNDYKRDLESSTQLYARVIGEYCIAPLAFGDEKGAHDMLTKIRALPDLTAALLYDPLDTLVAEFVNSGVSSYKPIRPDSLPAGFRDHKLVVIEPIRYQNVNYGTLILIASTDLMNKQIRDYVLIFISVMIVLLLVGYFLTNWLQGFVSQPILKLADFTNVISSGGDYSLRIERESDDEIGLLYTRFNEMLEQIGYRDKVSKEAQLEITLTNEKLNLILDNAPFGFLHYNEKGIITTCNRGHEEIFSLNRESLIGKSLFETIHDPVMLHPFEESLKGELSEFTGLYTSTMSGKSVYIRAIYTPLFSDDQRVIGGVGIFEDISEQKKSEKLMVEKEAAVFANKAKSIFLANMSHEIRTPLNAILGFSQLMEKDPTLTPDQRENVSIINTSGEHLLALINDVLEMSKIEAGRIQLNPDTFNLTDMLEDVVTLFRNRAKEKKIELHTDFQRDMPDYIFADEGKIRQILINLLSNALKFTIEGRVSIRVMTSTMDTGELLLHGEVEDTGIGIAADEIEKVFMHFEQTRSGKQAHSGTGLGLAICREYIRMMNGDITVSSEPGKGTIFRFHVGIEAATGVHQERAGSQTRVTGLQPGQPIFTIVVADDKEPNRVLLEKMLTGVGFRVEGARNGLEAVELYQRIHPDLILMDMFMPEMDGFEAIRKIRSLPEGSNVKIFAVTASVFEDDRDHVLEAGADEFIKKPFREHDIFEKIRDHLGVAYVTAIPDQVIELAQPQQTLNPEDIYALPEAEREMIREAIINGDLDLIEARLVLLSDEFPGIAGRLKELLKSFRLDQLNFLFQVS